MTPQDWALVIIGVLFAVQFIIWRLLMAAIDDLTTAVTNLEAAAANAVSKITTLKAVPGVDPTAVEALVARVNTVTSNLTAASS